MTASAKQNDTPRTAMTVQDWMRSLIATTPAYSLTSPLKSDDWRDQSVRAMRLALDELTAARAEAEALRKDAERYRYLRDQTAIIDGFWIARGIVGHLTQWYGDTADKAIDAARSERGKE